MIDSNTENYLKQLININSRFQLISFPELKGRKEITLPSLFVMPRVKYKSRDIMFDQLFQDTEIQRLVIQGESGSGKSTLSRFLLLENSKYLLHYGHTNDNLKLPVLVEIRKFNNAVNTNKPGYNIIDYIYDSTRSDYNVILPEGFFENYLDNGKVLVLFDGLDELPHETNRVEMKKMIDDFSSHYWGKNTMIVTSPTGVYYHTSFSSQDYTHVILEDFNDDDIDQLLTKWFQNFFEKSTEVTAQVMALKTALGKKTGFKELVRKPIFLMVILIIYMYESKLPDDQLMFYDKATEMLLNPIEDAKDIIDLKFKPDYKRRFLEKMAFQLQSMKKGADSGTLMERSEVYKIFIPDFCLIFGCDNNKAKEYIDEFLDTIWLRTGLLMELATDRFGFVHKKFQEYFAARWIANEVLLNFDLQIMIDYVNKYIYDISWHEILILALSALPQKQAKTILDHILTLGKIPPFYLKSISLENVKCFKGTHFLNLSNENKPANWTVILGNNGTGKTTLLQCIASLDPLHLKEGTRFADVNKEEQEFEIACHETKNPIQSLVGKIFYDLEDNSPQVKFLVENIDIVYHKYFEGKESGNFYAPIVYAYGASRKSGESLLTGESKSNRHDNLFYDKDLMNAEEWLAQADYASRKTNALAETNLKKIKKILLDILPDVKGFDFKTSENLRNYVEFLTDYGSVRFKDLSLGYRVMISWIVDLARQMFERYPSSSDPLSEPAIVLVDEIDLHLHPSWQRDIIHFLAKHFKKTQFIVTAHSPLIVQSAENVNVVLLQKDIAKGSVSISNEINVTYNGWTLEEILSDLMGLEKTVSDKYLLLTQKFEKAIYEDDAAAAKKIYDKLDKILHPENHLRKLMRIQMAALRGEGVE